MARKVLVVDDDPETRLIMSDFLAQLNVDHTLTASAGECLGRLVKEPEKYGMVLMDIHMPTLSGADASSWIADSEVDPPRNIPIVALTADDTFHDEDYIARFGMRGVLTKPVTLEQLEDILQKFMGS